MAALALSVFLTDKSELAMALLVRLALCPVFLLPRLPSPPAKKEDLKRIQYRHEK